MNNGDIKNRTLPAQNVGIDRLCGLDKGPVEGDVIPAGGIPADDLQCWLGATREDSVGQRRIVGPVDAGDSVAVGLSGAGAVYAPKGLGSSSSQEWHNLTGVYVRACAIVVVGVVSWWWVGAAAAVAGVYWHHDMWHFTANKGIIHIEVQLKKYILSDR